ncbi:MAG: hypothetical protein LBU53_11565 [Zoogloeaceae bacterium]|nr:hypothetical protein [Zoogloeaceae bacterium]
MLETLEHQGIAKLRQRLQTADCVFDFVAYRVTGHATPDEETHRQALTGLFAQIDEREKQYWRELALREPKHLSYCEQQLARKWAESTKIEDAKAHRLTPKEIETLVAKDSELERAFRHPPSDTKLNAKDFADWLNTLRMIPREGVEVLNWVGVWYKNPDSSNWSDYFDDGKEWWGIWCLTIYNPKQRTLSALAASATD